VGTTLAELMNHGFLTSKSPSKSSIDLEGAPCVRIENPCSLL